MWLVDWGLRGCDEGDGGVAMGVGVGLGGGFYMDLGQCRVERTKNVNGIVGVGWRVL